MDDLTARQLKKKLDAAAVELAGMIKHEIYDKVVVATVHEWFESSESLQALNDIIKARVTEAWPYVEKKVSARLLEFEEQTRTSVAPGAEPGAASLGDTNIIEDIGERISLAIGAIGTAVLAMLSGGGGVALIASGPLGWLLGAIIGAVAYFKGKDRLEEWMTDKRIPALAKKIARGKVDAKLRAHESPFERDVFEVLQEKLAPVYKTLEAKITG